MKNFSLALLTVIIVTSFSVLVNLIAPFKINLGFLSYNHQGIDLNFIPFVNTTRGFDFKRGLDLEGGTSITLQADMKDIPDDQRENALDSAKSVIEKRINFFGVSEPVVQTAKTNDDYRIIAEIPGVTDVNQAVKLIGTTAKLEFWEIDPFFDPNESLNVASSSAIPASILRELGPGAKKTDLTGADLKNSSVAFSQQTGEPEVQLEFTKDGAEKFADITSRNVGGILAITLDDEVIQAPRVNQAIFGGQAVITGSYTTDQAKNFQIQLNAGALPVSLSVLEQRATGPSLGQNSIEKSLIAGIIGLLIVIVFMIIIYGIQGFVASLALIIYTFIVLAIFKLVPVTLTLAGIAGFILSIGVAVDANILIFERMKEELAKGRSKEAAIEIGFTRAWPSIKDSNVASLITSFVLYQFGTPIVRGFAITLAIGVMVSMFSAITVTRVLLRIFYRS